jgi:hypothetical protein
VTSITNESRKKSTIANVLFQLEPPADDSAARGIDVPAVHAGIERR